jgi:CrcB protein
MGRNALFVAIGGAVGCVARFLIVSLVAENFPASIPYGTLLVNIIGSLVIGASVGFADRFHWMQHEWRIFLTAGFCGGFTTFSAFALENAQMLIERNYGSFAIYSLLSFALCIAAVFAGMQIAKI